MVSGEPVLLIVAAEAFELRGLERRMTRVRPLGWPIAFAREGWLGGVPVVLAADGAGPRRAALAMQAAALERPIRAILSTGLCGATDPALAAGDVFVATEVDAAELGRRYVVLKPATERRYPVGSLYSADHVISSAEEKSALRARGVSAVDMEAAAVARYACDNGIAFYCVRAVSDTAAESFVLNLNVMRDSSGRFLKGRLAWAALLRPWAALPELVRLWRRAGLASERLGEFLANCRF